MLGTRRNSAFPMGYSNDSVPVMIDFPADGGRNVANENC